MNRDISKDELSKILRDAGKLAMNLEVDRIMLYGIYPQKDRGIIISTKIKDNK